MVFVGGQPGDGKATITAMVKAVLHRRGRPVVLSATAYEPYHPRFHEPITDVPTTAGKYVAADGRRWLAQAEELVIEERYDAIVETEFLDPDGFAASARRFKEAGIPGRGRDPGDARGAQPLRRPRTAHARAGELRLRQAGDAERPRCRLRRCTASRRADRPGGVGRPDRRTASGRAADLRQPARRRRSVAASRADGRRDHLGAGPRRGLWWSPGTSWRLASLVGRIGLAAPVQWIRDESLEGAKTVTAMARPRLHPDAVTLHIATAGTQL